MGLSQRRNPRGLRRLSVKGGLGKIIEYHGPGVETLEVPERGTISNMGAELGATTTIFPSDDRTRRFLEAQGRGDGWREIKADPDVTYDENIKLDLSKLEPLIACPSSPDNIRKVREVEGVKVTQVIIGSCTNSSFRDLMVVAKSMEGKRVHEETSMEVNPGSRQILENIAQASGLTQLIHAGARIHQSGCLGCIGIGQAPATGTVSLRTFPRNFSGRSGTRGDRVYLCSPEVAVATAINGKITDPRRLGKYPNVTEPEKYVVNEDSIIPPSRKPEEVEVFRGPNIKPFPTLAALEDELSGKNLLKLGDDVTTDHILPGGSKILPLRSNIPALSEFTFENVDPTFTKRAKESGGGFIVAGENYGQGSSREHAALACRYLGVKAKIARSFARIHRLNLINFGVIPLVFAEPEDYKELNLGDNIRIRNVRDQIVDDTRNLLVEVDGRKIEYARALD